MGKLKDLTGQRFGRLAVLKLNGSRYKGGGVLWDCLCDCGATPVVSRSNLQSGSVVSCGCYQKEAATRAHRKPPGVAGFNDLFSRYKRSAKVRGVDFLLTESQFRELTSSDCYYCGEPPRGIARPGNSKKSYTTAGLEHATYRYNGLDRVDNKGHYSLKNCVPCCTRCNWVKGEDDPEVLFSHLQRMVDVYNSRVSKNKAPFCPC